MKEQEILESAIHKFGISNQMNQAIEECAELIQAINKVKRSGIVAYHITKPNANMDNETILTYYAACSEIADVKIMIKQLELMFSKEAIDLAYERKLARLEERINK